MNNFLTLTKEEQIALITAASYETGLRGEAIEKDWWVTLALKVLFECKYAKSLVFKGGTSLSKSWNLIERFSEDIDIAIDRRLLGFDEITTPSQIRKLRRVSAKFVKEELKEEILGGLKREQISEDLYKLVVEEGTSDEDPQKLYLEYQSLFEPIEYIAPRVQIECSARSLFEPFEKCEITSILHEYDTKGVLPKVSFGVDTVIPEKTLFEKAFLLHEEFCKDISAIKSHRMSRHFYDLHKIKISTRYKNALQNNELYKRIVAHREQFNKMRDVDYETLKPDKISFYPPVEIMKMFEEDYKTMRESMIYGSPPDFEVLMLSIKKLNEDFREIKFVDNNGPDPS